MTPQLDLAGWIPIGPPRYYMRQIGERPDFDTNTAAWPPVDALVQVSDGLNVAVARRRELRGLPEQLWWACPCWLLDNTEPIHHDTIKFWKPLSEPPQSNMT